MKTIEDLRHCSDVIYFHQNFFGMTIEFRQKKWNKKEWGKITTYRNKDYINIKYASITFWGTPTVIESKIKKLGDIPDDIPFWFQKYISVVLKTIDYNNNRKY